MRIGVDFGGTKIEAALMDAGGTLRARVRRLTPQSYEAAIAAIRDLVGEAEAAAGAKGISAGIAAPGSISPVNGLMRNANSTWLNGRALAQDLEAALARPVRIANDANCFALSEAVDGAAADAHCVFGVIVGTGCGGGVVIDKRVHKGASGVAGEWGHTPLPWAQEDETPGPACWCGKQGCLETWISGSGFRRWSGMSAEDASRSDAAEAGAALDLLYDRLARGLSVVINVLDPDAIVFGGGLSNLEGLYEGVARKLPGYVFSDVVRVRLLRNVHGDSSGVRGAAWLFDPMP